MTTEIKIKINDKEYTWEEGLELFNALEKIYGNNPAGTPVYLGKDWSGNPTLYGASTGDVHKPVSYVISCRGTECE